MGGRRLLVALHEGVEVHGDAVVLDVPVDPLRLLLVQRDVVGPRELLRQVLVPQLCQPRGVREAVVEALDGLGAVQPAQRPHPAAGQLAQVPRLPAEVVEERRPYAEPVLEDVGEPGGGDRLVDAVVQQRAEELGVLLAVAGQPVQVVAAGQRGAEVELPVGPGGRREPGALQQGAVFGVQPGPGAVVVQQRDAGAGVPGVELAQRGASDGDAAGGQVGTQLEKYERRRGLAVTGAERGGERPPGLRRALLVVGLDGRGDLVGSVGRERLALRLQQAEQVPLQDGRRQRSQRPVAVAVEGRGVARGGRARGGRQEEQLAVVDVAQHPVAQQRAELERLGHRHLRAVVEPRQVVRPDRPAVRVVLRGEFLPFGRTEGGVGRERPDDVMRVSRGQGREVLRLVQGHSVLQRKRGVVCGGRVNGVTHEPPIRIRASLVLVLRTRQAPGPVYPSAAPRNFGPRGGLEKKTVNSMFDSRSAHGRQDDGMCRDPGFVWNPAASAPRRTVPISTSICPATSVIQTMAPACRDHPGIRRGNSVHMRRPPGPPGSSGRPRPRGLGAGRRTGRCAGGDHGPGVRPRRAERERV